MKQIRTILAVTAAVFALPLGAVAAEPETIDEIEVVGEKSIAQLRKDVYAAEEEFYSIFNGLNDEPDFDVRCFYERPTGTRIKNHVCRAKFVTKAYGSHAARNRNDLSRVANQDANPAFAEKTAQYQAKMETLIAENPELMAAFVRYNDARVRFMAQRDAETNN